MSREVPIYALQYLIVSFGGMYTFDKDAEGITHMIVDRPTDKKSLKKELVQPQWVIDSVNNVMMLPTQKYFPGIPPPPHMSPFIDDKKEGYVPERQREINQLKGIEDDDEPMQEDDSEEEDEVKEEPQPEKAGESEDEDEDDS